MVKSVAAKKPYVSVVIPVMNEEESLKTLHAKLRSSLSRQKNACEIIFVDDGSTDRSLETMKNIQKKDRSVKIVKLRTHFGKSTALSAGFSCSRGDVIITMDADLQDDPDDIPKFLEKIKDFDVVMGWRSDRKDRITKRVSSKIFNAFSRRLLGTTVHDSNCGFKALRKSVTETLRLQSELYRYIPAIAAKQNYRVAEVEVKHNPRMHGKSKYGTGRLLRGIMDLFIVKFLMTYSRKPFHLFGLIGISLTFIGLLINAHLTYLWLLGNQIGDRPLLILGVLLMLTGLQSISLGLVGEMIVNKEDDFNRAIEEVI